MKTDRTQESPSKVRLSIEATAEEVAPALDRAFRELAGEVKVPGFRQGKVPRRILEARLEPGTIREAALREVVPALLLEAVKAENLVPVAPPSIEVAAYEVGGGIAFDATVEVRPEIRLPDFSSLAVARPSIAVTDEDVEGQIGRLRERFATLETVQRPAESGDFALVDLRTYVHDKTVEEASASDLLYEVGAERLSPDLDRELSGKRTGDILKFNTTLPEGFAGEFAGKEVSMQALVKEVRRKVLPEADDDFARSASEFETLDELRADLRARMEQVKARQADLEVRGRLLEQLVDLTGVEPPESLVQDEMAHLAGEFRERLGKAGVTLDGYLQASGETAESLEAGLRAQAERSVRARLVLDEVVKREEIAVTGEEMGRELLLHAQELGVEPGELRKRLERSERLGAVAGDILRRKALDLVVGRAEIRTEDA